MGYIYNLAQIRRNDFIGNSDRSAFFDLQTSTPLELAMGECLYMQLEIDCVGANYFDGQTFYINFALFRLLQRSNLANFGTGWRIDISETSPGVLTPNFNLVGSVPSVFNYRIINQGITPTLNRLYFDIILFATHDTQNWIGNFSGNNTARFLQPFSGGNALTQNAGQSAYRNNNGGISYFEIYGYETTNGTSPSSAFADPFIRMPTNPSVKQISKPVRAKWYDTHFNNAQSWTSTSTLAYNAIDTITAKLSPTGQAIAIIKRAKYPTLTDTTDLNYEPLSAQFPRSLSYTGVNYIETSLLLGTVLAPANIDRVSVRIIRVDNITNNLDFYSALEANENNIPFANPTPAPNWLNGGMSTFGTPTSITFASPTTISFTIDGTKLQFKGRYRLIFMVYDTVAGFVSTHISPELVADFVSPASIATPDTEVLTYNTQHINSNDVTISLFERFKLKIALDKTSYTGGIFDDELQLVELEEIQGSTVLNHWSYSFAAGATNLNSVIELDTNSVTDLIMAFERRGGYSLPLLVNLTTFIYRWKFTFNQVTANGVQTNTYQMDMFIRVKPIDAARINGIEFLDAADFDASIETKLAYICAADNEVIVKISKNGAPDANLIALMLQSVLPNPPVYENAAYSSPVGLSNINSPIMSQVDTVFSDDFAYYRIDLTQIRGANNFLAGALIYNI